MKSIVAWLRPVSVVVAVVGCDADEVGTVGLAERTVTQEVLDTTAVTGVTEVMFEIWPAQEPLVDVSDVATSRFGLVVADEEARRIFLLPEQGGSAAVGRHGEGPGEYSGSLTLSMRGDTAFVFDAGLQRLTALELPALRTVRSVRLSPTESGVFDQAWVMPLGDIVGVERGLASSEAARGPGELERLRRLVHVRTSEERGATLVEFVARRSFWLDVGRGRVAEMNPPFYPWATVDAEGGRVIFSGGARFEVVAVTEEVVDTALVGDVWTHELTDQMLLQEKEWLMRGGADRPAIRQMV